MVCLPLERSDIAARPARASNAALIGAGAVRIGKRNRIDGGAAFDERVGLRRPAVVLKRADNLIHGDVRDNVARSRGKAVDARVAVRAEEVVVVGIDIGAGVIELDTARRAVAGNQVSMEVKPPDVEVALYASAAAV